MTDNPKERLQNTFNGFRQLPYVKLTMFALLLGATFFAGAQYHKQNMYEGPTAEMSQEEGIILYSLTNQMYKAVKNDQTVATGTICEYMRNKGVDEMNDVFGYDAVIKVDKASAPNASLSAEIRKCYLTEAGTKFGFEKGDDAGNTTSTPLNETNTNATIT